ncbi:4-hydroxybenzoate 3-monooxygenase [Hymenobacter polaris]|nr:4-hydroxybenzoate 3-monooxygenase [Hymenobacter polaris]
METTVAIVGAGVAGLTLATFLHQAGVPCVVLERRDRAYLEQRQRAGVVEARGVRMFERWGLADQLLGGPVAQTIDYRLDGTSRIFELSSDDGSQGRFCTQQMLVHNLLRELLDQRAGDVRFGVTDLSIDLTDSERPRVRYADATGAHELSCAYVVGCDGSRGTSRAAIPAGVLTTYHHEFGYAWLAALVEAPLVGHPIMGVSDYGFVGQLPRGPQRSRYYLQCALSDTAEDWPNERLWHEIRRRTGDATLPEAPVLDKFFVPLRSVVHAPMQYGRLFLAGDAAHLVPPASAKGMNLALYDVDVLAQALRQAVHAHDETALQTYSDTCLAHVWRYQEFAVEMTDMLHDAGDATQHGAFRRQVARAKLAALFTSPTDARRHSEFQRGLA